ncbi:MAG: hypothetical protein AAFP84_04020 [Actinomycetota bacterium]
MGWWRRTGPGRSRSATLRRLAYTAAVVAVATLVFSITGAGARAPAVDAAPPAGSVATWCRNGHGPAELDRMFDGDPGGIVGADYPRTLALPDGRVLWTFQDPIVRDTAGALHNLHNIGIVQDGACFDLLRSGTSAAPAPWLLATQTIPERAWFWPLDMTLSADGTTVHVFLAQMFEDDDGTYLNRATPNSVVVVDVDATTLGVRGGPSTPPWGGLASDPTLFGWSVETAGNHTYLFGHCHRQFGFDPFFDDVFIHDTSCTKQIRLARVPRGGVFATPEYWTGTAWSRDRAAARSLLPTERVNVTQPTQFQFVNGRWMATTKVDDWFGQWIVIDQANKVTGPWRQTERRFAGLQCDPDPPGDDGPVCTNYFSSFVDDPTRTTADPVVISLSHNLWSGEPSSLYRPTYEAIDPPVATAALADRCALDQC